jgi:hypothetical protein
LPSADLGTTMYSMPLDAMSSPVSSSTSFILARAAAAASARHAATPFLTQPSTLTLDDSFEEIGDDIGDDIGNELGEDIGEDLGEDIGEDIGEKIGTVIVHSSASAKPAAATSPLARQKRITLKEPSSSNLHSASSAAIGEAIDTAQRGDGAHEHEFLLAEVMRLNSLVASLPPSRLASGAVTPAASEPELDGDMAESLLRTELIARRLFIGRPRALLALAFRTLQRHAAQCKMRQIEVECDLKIEYSLAESSRSVAALEHMIARTRGEHDAALAAKDAAFRALDDECAALRVRLQTAVDTAQAAEQKHAAGEATVARSLRELGDLRTAIEAERQSQSAYVESLRYAPLARVDAIHRAIQCRPLQPSFVLHQSQPVNIQVESIDNILCVSCFPNKNLINFSHSLYYSRLIV